MDAPQLGRDAGAPSAPPEPSKRRLGSGRAKTRRLQHSDQSLAFFPLLLQGTAVIVELRNLVFLRGTIYMADLYMKCGCVLTRAARHAVCTLHMRLLACLRSATRCLHAVR
jgi:hypothetical protein